jgi:hypothetical protein
LNFPPTAARSVPRVVEEKVIENDQGRVEMKAVLRSNCVLRAPHWPVRGLPLKMAKGIYPQRNALDRL